MSKVEFPLSLLIRISKSSSWRRRTITLLESTSPIAVAAATTIVQVIMTRSKVGHLKCYRWQMVLHPNAAVNISSSCLLLHHHPPKVAHQPRWIALMIPPLPVIITQCIRPRHYFGPRGVGLRCVRYKRMKLMIYEKVISSVSLPGRLVFEASIRVPLISVNSKNRLTVRTK
jgi:hypothetical protein